MRFSDTEEYLGTFCPDLFEVMQNGECRFLALPADAEPDAQGYPDDDRTPRTAGFLPAIWNFKVWNGRAGHEQILANAVRNSPFYEISVPKIYEDAEIVCQTSDRIELKEKIGAVDWLTLEIVAVNNQANNAWLIHAINPDAENES